MKQKFVTFEVFKRNKSLINNVKSACYCACVGWLICMSRGKFIVFEGIDGSGKGTQMCKAMQFVFELNKANDVYMTREPTRAFSEIRTSLAECNDDLNSTAHWYAQMFVKDRWNHIRVHIEPALRNGTHVLCDRYKHSTLAYQTTQGMADNLK